MSEPAEQQEEEGFETRLQRLEDLVETLEDGDLSLDDAVASYRSGMTLLQSLQGHLDGLERKIEKLTARGETKDLEFDSGEDA